MLCFSCLGHNRLVPCLRDALSGWVDGCYETVRRGVKVFGHANNHHAGHAEATVQQFRDLWYAKGLPELEKSATLIVAETSLHIMSTRVDRRTVDLSGYRDLVVIYLGMRVNRIIGIKTLLGFGPEISASTETQPDGLLRHETVIYSLFPMHIGMRQYWRDVNSLLKWTRSDPHRQWWKRFLKDSGGTGFWHETYFLRGGMEAIYDDMPQPIGFMAFAPVLPARGPMFGAASRSDKEFESQPVLSEKELYDEGGA
jgi:hypothetical protein